MTTSPHSSQHRTVLPCGPGNPVTPLCHSAEIHIQPSPSQAKEPAANTFNASPNRSTREVDAYIRRLIRTAQRIASANTKRSAFDNDDIVSIVLEKFSANMASIMANYTAEQYARVAMRHAPITLSRTERVQRSEGVRLEYVEEPGQPGYWRKRRSYVSGSSPVLDGDGELFDYVEDTGTSVEDTVVEAEHRRVMLEACLAGLTPRRREWLVQVDGDEIPVTEVAERANLARETVSREVSRARRQVESQRVMLYGERGEAIS